MASATVVAGPHASGVPTEALAQSIREHLGSSATIIAAEVASEGMSDDTWMLDVEVGGERVGLVVRRYRPGGPVREQTDPGRHFRVLAALPRDRVPAPEPLWYEPDPEVVGGPFFVMRRIEGTVVVPWSPKGQAFLREAGAGPLGERFVAALADIHALPWQGTDLEFLGPGEGDAARQLAASRAAVERYQLEPEPILTDALGWLARHVPRQERTTLVHGDFRTGNVVFGDDVIAGVLDWEFARVGDPAADLGWLLARTNALGSDLAAYILPRDRVLDLYERFAGWVPSDAALHFWEVLHLVFNTTLWMSGEFNYVRGATASLTLARWSYTLPKMRRLVLDALEGR